MDVRMPDGTIITNVPDDATKEDVAERYAQYQKPSPPPATTMDRARAAATAVNRLPLQFAGMPVDAAANVIDLLKMPAGVIYHKFTGKPVPDALAPFDMSKVPLSSEWLIDKARQISPAIVDMPRPDDPVSRALSAATSGAGSMAIGGPKAALTGAASGLAQNAAAEAGAPPAVQILAGLGPQAAATGMSMLIKGDNIAETQRRMQVLKEAGVEKPPVGLATGTRVGAFLDAALGLAPGSAGVMAENYAREAKGMQGKVQSLADQLAPSRGDLAAGTAVQQGIDAYRARLNDIENRLYGKVAGQIPANTRFPVPNSTAAGIRVTEPIPSMPEVSALTEPKRAVQMSNALANDTAGKVNLSMIFGPDGKPLISSVTPPGATFPGMKEARSRVGADLNAAITNPLMSSTDIGALKQVYGGLSQDMRNAAEASGAGNAFNRANKVFAQGATRLEQLKPFAQNKNETMPAEQSFQRFMSAAQNRGSQAATVLKSLPEPQRNTVIASVIDDLGKTNPSTGTRENAFSPDSFLTNWRKLDDTTKAQMFGNNSPVADQLDKVVEATEMMRKHSRAWINPSGTARASAAQRMLQYPAAGAIGALAMGHPLAAFAAGAAAAGAAGMANVTARMMTSPIFLSWLQKSADIPPQRIKAHLARLAINATQIKDDQTRQDVENYIGQMSQ